MNKLFNFIVIVVVLFTCSCDNNPNNFATPSNSEYFILNKNELSFEGQNLNHKNYFGKYVKGYNNFILEAVDIVQSSAMDGGGYFIGLSANPPESPIGYNIQLMGHQMIEAPRTTSYCSGASYSAFLESLNLIAKKYRYSTPDSARLEAFRMQEIDDSRREDHIKFWGKWNADGFGSHFALVQYSGMGQEVKPNEARPGDFANISWKSGNGHSVVFLSWVVDENGKKYLLYWSSQKSTNGLADQLVSVDRIKNIKIVRLTKPGNMNVFNIQNENINTQISGDSIDF